MGKLFPVTMPGMFLVVISPDLLLENDILLQYRRNGQLIC